MNARIKFYLRNPSKMISAVYASFCYTGKRVIIFPGISIAPKDWDSKKGLPKTTDDFNIKKRLLKDEELYLDIYEQLQKTAGGNLSPAVLKKAIYDVIKPAVKVEEVPTKPILVLNFFQQLLDDCKSGARKSKDDLFLNPNSLKAYKSAKNHFEQFQTSRKRKFYLTDINQALIKDFTNYLNNKLAINTSAKYLTIFKLLIAYANEMKLIDFKQSSEIKIIVRKEKSDSVYLTESQVKELREIKSFPTKVYELVLDYFILGCNTGLRFSDFSVLKIENIKNGFIEIDPNKNKRLSKSVTKVIIPVHPMVTEVLMKYPDGLPKCPPNQVCNRYIKELASRVPSLNTAFEKKITRANRVQIEKYMVWQKVSTHTCRRSWCTNMFLRGVPIITIMAISGHKTQENFMKYIKADNQKHADILKKFFDEDENKMDENDEDCAVAV